MTRAPLLTTMPPLMDGRILKIVADIITEPKSLKKLEQDPEAFMDSYGLTQDEKVLLFTCCRPLIAEAIRREVDAWYVKGPGGNAPMWPGPDPGITSFAPTSAKKGGKVTIEVSGEAILKNAELRLVQKDAKKPFLPAIGPITARGTFRKTVLSAEVSLKGAPAGEYEVQVINGENVLYVEPRDPWPTKQHDARNAGLPPLVAAQPFVVK